MSETTVGKRYAKSLIDLAKEQNNLEAVKGDMIFFAQTLKANSELAAVLRNPIVSHDRKVKILEAVFGGKVTQATISFFKIMVNKGRGEVLYPAALEFVNQYDVIKHIVTASVVTAAPLSDVNRAEIMAEVKRMAGGEVVLQEKVDPALIGGFILTIGDRQLDTSVATGLVKLRKDFAEQAIQ